MVRNSLNEINEKLFLSFMNPDNSNSIESVLQEQRVFSPSDAFAKKSRISSFSRYLEMSEGKEDKAKTITMREALKVPVSYTHLTLPTICSV